MHGKNLFDKFRKTIKDLPGREDSAGALYRSLFEDSHSVMLLKGILPLCSFCKKIRNPKGDWEEVDVYIHHHSEADVSHAVCPACMKKHYPEYSRE